ncbi:MAG: 16S rRNA processing protein RimM [Gottschalkiaceae bacterium]|nr:MAG: 16S rRNA processing protein RimM [Gottschalkiaceae bacterium]
MLEYISIGQIVNTYGVKGELKVYPLTDDIRRFDKVKIVYIEENQGLYKYEIQHIKYLNNIVIVKFKNVEDIESAEKFRNKYIKVHRNDAVKLPEDSFFVCDIIDTDVFTVEGEPLGKVYDVIQTGSNDVFVVKTEDKEILIPALKTIFKEIDIIKGRIVVKLPEGLI